MPACPVLLMVRQLDHGGSERQAAEIAKNLDRSRFLPHAGVFRAGGLRWRELHEAGIPVVRFPVDSLADLRGIPAIARYVWEQGIRLIHTFDVPTNLYAAPAARLAGCEVVVTSQRAHRGLEPRSRPWLRLVDFLSDGVVVNCDFLRRHLVEEERTPAGRVHLCYNGINPVTFRPRGGGERPEPLQGASLVIGVVCVLRPEKGLNTLLEAFARVKDRQPGMKLAVVGSGSCLPELCAQAQRLGIVEDCVFEPSTADVPRWLGAIDIFVLPSWSEAFSNSLMEAMACGCCAVASRVGGNPELVCEGETGLLFEAGDAAGLATALERLIARPEWRAELACNGMRRVRERFGIEQAARRMEEIYRLLLSREGM